jgi:hypothetical protein
VQRLEAALHAFTEGAFDDDAAMLAIAPVAASSGADLPVSSSSPPLASEWGRSDG